MQKSHLCPYGVGGFFHFVRLFGAISLSFLRKVSVIVKNEGSR